MDGPSVGPTSINNPLPFYWKQRVLDIKNISVLNPKYDEPTNTFTYVCCYLSSITVAAGAHGIDPCRELRQSIFSQVYGEVEDKLLEIEYEVSQLCGPTHKVDELVEQTLTLLEKVKP